MDASCEPQFHGAHSELCRRDPYELSDDILYSIIGRLNLREAVRATVLSRGWSKVVISYLLQCNELVFTSNTMLGLNYIPSGPSWEWTCNLYDLHYVGCGSHGMKVNPCNKVKFVRSVNQFLDFYRKICSEGDGEFLVKKPNISCFAVKFCLESGFSSDIERWIEFATQFLRVHSLFLELQCDLTVFKNITRYDPSVVKNKEKFVISSKNNGDYEFFKPGFDLNNLRLRACVLDASLFGNRLVFGSLTELTLTSVPLARYDVDSMFGSFVNIETLLLKHCSLPIKFCLGSMPSLQNVHLIECLVQVLSTSNNLKLTQATINTKIQLELEGAPNLESLTAKLDKRAAYSLFDLTLEKLPVLSVLDVTTDADYFNFLPIHSSIKSLRLRLFDLRTFDVLKMIHLVKALPSMCELQLSMMLDKDSGEVNIETNDIAIRHLKQVRISTNRVTKALFQFASYLLKHATSFQRLKLTKWSPCDEEELHYISVLKEHSGNAELVNHY